MKTKQIIILLGILFLGILIGKWAFSDSKQSQNIETQSTEKHSEHWTCSMHPQIDLPEFGQCPICGMDLILKTEETGINPNSIKLSANAVALANVQTQLIGDSKLETSDNKLVLPGTIRIDTDKTSTQTAHFGGRIEKLFFQSTGTYIAKGSKIALVYSPELTTAQNELLEALAIKEEQPELYQAVRNKLKNWKLSENQIHQIEQTQKIQTNFPMFADKSGYIQEVLTQNGAHIKEGSPLYSLANLNSIWASFDVYEKDISRLKKGQKIQIQVSAYPEKTWQTRIDFINPILNTSTRTVEVRAQLQNPGNQLKPGMLLTGSIALQQNEKNTELYIPKTAVLWTGKRSIVYIKPHADKPEFELREITLGNTTGTQYKVLSGLTKGEEIVVNGTFTIDAAAQLQGKTSMMNRTKPDKAEKKTPNKSSNTEMKCASGKCGGAMKK